MGDGISWNMEQNVFYLCLQTAHTHLFVFQVKGSSLSYRHYFPGKVAVAGNYINYRVKKKKKVILDNLCSKLIIAGKENCFSSLYFHISQTPSFQGVIILLACFASIITFAFFSQGQFLVCHQKYLHMGLFRSVPLYLHQIIFDKGCKRPINPTS